MLTVIVNMLLINLICQDFTSHNISDISQHKLVLTGSHPMSVKIIKHGVIIKRLDMETTQEEVDTLIVQQLAEVTAN